MFGVDDDVPGRDHVDAVGERIARQVGVEQRDHAADSGDADPDRQELGPVGHQQADRVALGDALRERPAGVAVRARAKLAVAQVLAVGEQRRRVAVFRPPAPRSVAGTRALDSWRYASCTAARAARRRTVIRSAASRSKNSMTIPCRRRRRDSRRRIIGYCADGGKGPDRSTIDAAERDQRVVDQGRDGRAGRARRGSRKRQTAA